MKSDLRLMLAKIEAVYGVDSAPASANTMLIRWRDLPQPAPSDYVDRQLLRPYLGRSQLYKANSKVTFSFASEAAGSGTAGTPPPWRYLARMCGFAETTNTGVSTVYNPISTGEESSTIYYWIDGIQQKVVGCRGSLSLNFAAGQVPLINFDAMGVYAAPTDAAMGTPSWTFWKDPLVANNTNTPTFTLHGYGAKLRELRLDIARERIWRDWVNTRGVELGGRTPSGSVTIEMPAIASKDYFTIDQASTPGALVLIHGTVAGNIFRIDAPKVQLMNPRYATEQDLLLLTMDVALLPNAGNDELTITLT
jgi:hypothetical protein